MITKFRSLKDNSKSYILSVILTAFNILFVLVAGLRNYTSENKAVSRPLFILSVIIVVFCFSLLIFLRIKRYLWIIKGIFIYEIIGIVCYLLFFVGYIGSQGGETQLNTFYIYFSWWTIGFEPSVLTLSRFIGIPLKFTMGIFYFLYTYFTGSAYLSVRKDISYEKRLEEDRLFEEEKQKKHLY